MKSSFSKIIALFLAVVTCFSIAAATMAYSKVEAAGETFFIDPGHGGSDPGAISSDSKKSAPETGRIEAAAAKKPFCINLENSFGCPEENRAASLGKR